MWDQLSIYIFTQHGFIPRSILKLSHSALLIRHVRVLICNRQVLWPVFHLWIFKAGVAHELQLFIFTWPSISVHCLQRDDRLMEMRLDSFYVLLSLKLMSDFLDVNPKVIHLCDTDANHSFYQVFFRLVLLLNHLRVTSGMGFFFFLSFHFIHRQEITCNVWKSFSFFCYGLPSFYHRSQLQMIIDDHWSLTTVVSPPWRPLRRTNVFKVLNYLKLKIFPYHCFLYKLA